MPAITSDQLLSLLRTVLKIAGALVVAHGTLGINGAMWEQISGGVLMIVPVVWDMFNHSTTGQLRAVEAMPEVKKITVVPTVNNEAVSAAAADPSRPKVST